MEETETQTDAKKRKNKDCRSIEDANPRQRRAFFITRRERERQRDAIRDEFSRGCERERTDFLRTLRLEPPHPGYNGNPGATPARHVHARERMRAVMPRWKGGISFQLETAERGVAERMPAADADGDGDAKKV